MKCRVIGTFYLEPKSFNGPEDGLVLRFGSDLSNYYPNRGLKVYKPTQKALERLVNYRDPNRDDLASYMPVDLGVVRYALNQPCLSRSFRCWRYYDARPICWEQKLPSLE